MSDHADIVRDGLHYMEESSDGFRYFPQAIAALDALVAERDEALYQQKVQRTFGEEQWALRKAAEARAEAAEAELVIEREHNPSRVICPKCQANLPCESCKRYSVVRDELEAEVVRLREALDGLVEAVHRANIPDNCGCQEEKCPNVDVRPALDRARAALAAAPDTEEKG